MNAAGGNPYGTSAVNGVSEAALDAARHQGRRLTRITSRLLGESELAEVTAS